MKPSKQQVREAAYFRWVNMGRLYLDEEGQRRNWLEAEKEVLAKWEYLEYHPYRLLLRTSDLEIRKYKPCKRTINVTGRFYFLQFPYMVFAVRQATAASGLKSYFFYVAFAKKEDSIVYFPSLSNVCSQTWAICLSLGSNHFRRYEQSFKKLIETFWSTSFTETWEVSRRSLEQNFQGRYNYWKTLNLKEVLEHITYMPRSFEDFVARVSKDYSDDKMRSLISDLTDVDPVVKSGETALEGKVAGIKVADFINPYFSMGALAINYPGNYW